MPATRPRFHLAFPVHDLARAREFYGGLLGCAEGRSSETWVDFDFHGHQIVAHLDPGARAAATNEVDGEQVPVRHFGLILARDEWEALAQRLTEANADFIIAPQIRFRGQPGEQAIFFVRDPSGNALEFKSFASEEMIFAQ